MGRKLNDKYGLDCFSDSELDSEPDEGEEYRYKHKYEHAHLNSQSLLISVLKRLKYRICKMYSPYSFI